MDNLAAAVDGGSHSARSAWIETSLYIGGTGESWVALRKECVD